MVSARMARLKAEYLGDTTSSAATKFQERLQQISNQLSPAMASPFSVDVVPQAPEDPLFGLMAAYKADTFDKKVDLGVGAYRDNNAKPWVLPVVKKVRFQLLKLHRLEIPTVGAV
jgi:aspartate aminotransferase